MNVHPIRKENEPESGQTAKSRLTRFQLIMITYAIAATVAVAVVYVAAGAWFFHEYGQLAESMGFPPGHRIYRFFDEQRTNLFGVLAMAGMISSVCVAGAAVLFSRSVARSLQRLSGQMREVADGRTDAEIQASRGEWFPELLVAVNRLIRSKTGKADGSDRRAA